MKSSMFSKALVLSKKDVLNYVGDGFIVADNILLGYDIHYNLYDKNILTADEFDQFYNTPHNIVIPEGIVCIRNNCFDVEPFNIVSITIPESVKFIDSRAFARTSMKSMDFPESLLEIGNGVLDGCNKLEKVFVPKGLLCKGSGVLKGCESLKEFTFKNHESILYSVLEHWLIELMVYCPNLEVINFEGDKHKWSNDVDEFKANCSICMPSLLYKYAELSEFTPNHIDSIDDVIHKIQEKFDEFWQRVKVN